MEHKIVTASSALLIILFATSMYYYGPYEGVLRVLYGGLQVFDFCVSHLLNWMEDIFAS